MNWWDEIRKRAKPWKSLELPSPPVDLDRLRTVSGTELEVARKEAEDLLEKLGISESERDVLLGKTVQENNRMIYKSVREGLEKQGLIIEETNIAVKRFDWLRDYFFKIFPINENALTAYHTKNWNNGVFVHAKKGVKFKAPVHAFFLLNESSFAQTPHSIIIAEDDSEVHIVEGCTAPVLMESSLHVGGTEIFVGKGAKVFLTKLQNWPRYVHTRPLTYARVEEGGELHFINIVIGGGRTTVEHPLINLAGKDASVTIHEVTLSRDESFVDLGANIHHNAENTKSEIVSKTVAMENSTAITRGVIHAHRRGARGHFSCDGMIMGSNARAEAYPGLATDLSDAQLTHEASFGKIARKEIIYLRSRGFTEEEAVELIVKGFVSPVLVDVPSEFRIEVERIIELAARGM